MSDQFDLFNSLGKSLKPEQSYFNTTKLSGDKLKANKKKSRNQDDVILDLFRSKKDVLMTPGYVHKTLFDESTPLTSIRRSITNLTNSGYLEKTNQTKEGVYGRDEFCWKYKN